MSLNMDTGVRGAATDSADTAIDAETAAPAHSWAYLWAHDSIALIAAAAGVALSSSIAVLLYLA